MDERRVRAVITVTIEVSEKFTKRRVCCTAQSIERAVEIVRGSRSSNATTKVLFPINPESFFADPTDNGIVDEAAPLESRPKERARS